MHIELRATGEAAFVLSEQSENRAFVWQARQQ